MFVSGMIAELEASLRATALATEKSTYGITSAKRAARGSVRLASIHAKVDSSQLQQILDIFKSIKLQLNNEAQLPPRQIRLQHLDTNSPSPTRLT